MRDINPTLDLRVLSEGVNERNIDAFLDGVDVYVDGLDFFAFGARQTTFEACARRNIPVTAAPLGMGGAVVVFMPRGMTFEQYFRIKGRPEFDQAIRLLVGLAPAMLHRGYIVDRSTVDLTAQRVPSTALACDIYARDGRRGGAEDPVETRRCCRAAPAGIQFDAYTGKLRRTVRPGGNRHPLQRLAIAVARRQLREETPMNPEDWKIAPYSYRSDEPRTGRARA